MGLPGTETEWDLGTEASFCPSFLTGKTPASMTSLEFQRADYGTVANQGGAARKPPEARLKGPEKLVHLR